MSVSGPDVCFDFEIAEDYQALESSFLDEMCIKVVTPIFVAVKIQ